MTNSGTIRVLVRGRDSKEVVIELKCHEFFSASQRAFRTLLRRTFHFADEKVRINSERRNSPSRGRPSTSSWTVWLRLPCATAAMARVTSVVGRSRSSTKVLIETSISLQAPLIVRNRVRSRVRPSLPTAYPTRFNSPAMFSFAAMISLKVSAIFPVNPVHDPGSRAEKSPCCIRWRLARIALNSGVGGSAPIRVPFPGFGPSDGVRAAGAVAALFASMIS